MPARKKRADDDPDPGTSADGPEAGPSRPDILRWSASVLLAVAAGIFYFHTLAHESVCRHQPLAGGSPYAVKVCGPPRLLDLVPFVLLIAVLLWPDLGELAVAGLLTLRRRVVRQEERQGEVEAGLRGVDQRLTQLAALQQSQMQGQAQTAVGVSNHYHYAADQDDLRRSIDAKETAEEGGHEEAGPEGRPPAPSLPAGTRRGAAEAPGERKRLLGEFIDSYSRLEPYLSAPGSRLRGAVDLDAGRRRAVEEWREMFEPEIAAMRQTRNAAVHRPGSVGTETLRGAVRNTRELSRILFGRIGSPEPPTG